MSVKEKEERWKKASKMSRNLARVARYISSRDSINPNGGGGGEFVPPIFQTAISP